MMRRLVFWFLAVFLPHSIAFAQCADTLTAVFTGDILLDRGVRRMIEHGGMDRLFAPEIDSILLPADVVVGNLECPATVVRRPVFKRFVFRGEPEWLEGLRRHGFTHLNLANNHSIDQGREGLEDTWLNIRHYGMTPVGAGRDMQEAARPVLIAERPRRVYLLASLRLALENMVYLPEQPCVSQEPFDSLVARVRALRRREPGCCIIVNLHWGAEHTMAPVTQQRVEARMLIAAGADAIIGHHSHTLQTSESFAGRPIYYSIGNFIFDQTKPINTHACVVRLRITAGGLTAESIPIETRWTGVRSSAATPSAPASSRSGR